MKLNLKLLCLLLTIFVSLSILSSCKDNEPTPANKLSGTTWSKYYFDVPGPRQVHKVLKFSDNEVRVDFLFDKRDVYLPIGSLAYTLEGEKLYVVTASGQVYGDSLVLNGETFVRE